MKIEKLTYLIIIDHVQGSYWLRGRRLIVSLFFMCISLLAGAAEVDAGEDQQACPGEEVVIGGEPTAGPDPEGDYKYSWTASDGSFTSDEANPTVTVQDKEVTYTVVVEDRDGFKCDDSMTITPLQVTEIQFDPEKLPADGESKATATAITTPEEFEVVWSLQDDDLGASIDPSSGEITAGEKEGYLTVRAQEEQAADDGIDGCYLDVPYCVGQECCADITEIRAFGPISASFAEPVVSQGKDEDEFCIYKTSDATISVGSLNLFNYDYDLSGVTITWKERTTQSGTEYKEVNITWNGKESTREFGKLKADLTEVEIEVSSSGAISGEIRFQVNQTQDAKLGGIAVLKKGTTGKFAYKYASAQSFEGEWDFSGVTGVKIELIKERKTIARVTGTLLKNGDFSGRLKDNGPVSYTANQFNVTLNKLDIKFLWNISESMIDIENGTGEIEIHDIKPSVEGNILMALTFDGATITASASMDGVRAFGCDLSGDLSGDMDTNFDIGTIVGSSISAQHPDFDQSFDNVGFEVALGKLERFDIGAVEVKYNSGLYFNMTDASYDGNQSVVFDADLKIASLDVEVTRFAISAGGEISIGKAKVDVKRKPFEVSGFIDYEDQKFRGKFRGGFTGGIKVEGTTILGAESDFNYGFFAVGLDGGKAGVPIPATPLKVSEFGGEFGYNWDPADPFGSIQGKPAKDQVLVGVKLGIGDIANLAELKGRLRVTLGAADKIEIAGGIRVPGNQPYYVNGNADVEYVLGSGNVGGSLDASIKFPRGKGTTVLLQSGKINFNIGQNNKYSVNAAGLSGQLFEKINLNGSINFSGPMDNVFALEGSVSGSVDYSDTFDYTYPSGFNPATCATADDTDNVVGFGITGQLDVELGGNITAQLDNEGITGSFGVNASGFSDMSVKWPCAFTCGDDCVSMYTTGVSGELNIEYNNPEVRIYGEATFTSGDETETGEVDFTF